MPIRRGDRVCTSGKGRTAKWRKYCGTVTMRRKKSVFVVWDGARFTEDEMNVIEVKKVKGKVKKPVVPMLGLRKLLPGFER